VTALSIDPLVTGHALFQSILKARSTVEPVGSPPTADATSYRSELEANKGDQDISEEIPITRIVQTCDNLVAVTNINKPFTNPSQILAPEADIILACHHQCRKKSIAR